MMTEIRESRPLRPGTNTLGTLGGRGGNQNPKGLSKKQRKKIMDDIGDKVAAGANADKKPYNRILNKRGIKEEQLQELTGKGRVGMVDRWLLGKQIERKQRVSKWKGQDTAAAYQNTPSGPEKQKLGQKVKELLNFNNRLKRMRDRIDEETLDESSKHDGYRDGKLQMVNQKRYDNDKVYKTNYDKGSGKTIGRTAAKYRSIDTRPAGKKHLPRGGQLEEAVSRKLTAKKNATKQRVRFVQRKGELPPIMKGKGRYNITYKETNKLSGILAKQKSFRRDAKNATLEKKKGYTLPDPPQSSRATSMSVYAKAPTPGIHTHNAQPHIARPMNDPVRAGQKPDPERTHSSTVENLARAFNHYSGRYGQSGNQSDLDAAKKAAFGHYASMIAKISHHPGHPDYGSAKANAKDLLDSHLDVLSSIEGVTPKRLVAPTPKKKSFLSRLLRKK